MLDTSITLSFMGAAQLRRIGTSLRAKDDRSMEAGWFLRAYKNEGYEDIVKYVRVSPERALLIAQTTPFPVIAEEVMRVNKQAEKDRVARIAALRDQIANAKVALALLEGEA